MRGGNPKNINIQKVSNSDNGKNMFEQYILVTSLDANYVNIVEPSQV